MAEIWISILRLPQKKSRIHFFRQEGVSLNNPSLNWSAQATGVHRVCRPAGCAIQAPVSANAVSRSPGPELARCYCACVYFAIYGPSTFSDLAILLFLKTSIISFKTVPGVLTILCFLTVDAATPNSCLCGFPDMIKWSLKL